MTNILCQLTQSSNFNLALIACIVLIKKSPQHLFDSHLEPWTYVDCSYSLGITLILVPNINGLYDFGSSASITVNYLLADISGLLLPSTSFENECFKHCTLMLSIAMEIAIVARITHILQKSKYQRSTIHHSSFSWSHSKNWG